MADEGDVAGRPEGAGPGRGPRRRRRPRRRRPLLLASIATLLSRTDEASAFAVPPPRRATERGGGGVGSRGPDAGGSTSSLGRSESRRETGGVVSGRRLGVTDRRFSAADADRRYEQRFGTFVASLAVGMALVFAGPVPNANAGFGPSSRAVVSPPPGLVKPNVQDSDLLSDKADKKLRQLIGNTIDENRLEQFSIQVDNLAEALNNFLSNEDDATESEDAADAKAELERAKLLQRQIADREELLDQLDKQPYWFNYLAAFIGSVASTLAMHPLDTIKTRLQIRASGEGESDCDEVEKGIGDLAGLYEGLTGNILKEGPPSALYLGVYESVKHSLLPRFDAQSVLLVYLLSGAAGELVGSAVRAPAEAVKSTVQSGLEPTASAAARRVFGTPESRSNVVRAWSASIWRDVPFGAIQLAIFELVKAHILNDPNLDFDSGTLASEALIGAFAGGCGALLTNPFDIVTTRIITQDVDAEETGGGGGGDEVDFRRPLGVLEMASKLYEEGGTGAFLVGWKARVAYWAPAISIFLTCYCSVRQAAIGQGWFSS